LFLRRPHSLEPTAVALRLEASVASAVESLRNSLVRGQKFSPESAEGIIRLAALDAEQASIVPVLVRHITNSAPKLKLSVLPLSRRDAMEALSNNEVDLAVGFYWNIPVNLISVPLYEQDFVVVGRAEILGGSPLTLEHYVQLNHVLVSPAGDLRGVADEALKARGLSRKVIASVPEFFPALAAVAASDTITTLPRGLAQRYASALGLIVLDPPIELRRFQISALRHRRNEHDQRLLWVLQCLKTENSI
jgi:DNA-binding transcriptional LysR family regulator